MHCLSSIICVEMRPFYVSLKPVSEIPCHILMNVYNFVEDDVINEVKDVMVETSYGVKDLFDIKYVGNERRSFKNQDSVMMRITKDQIALNSHNPCKYQNHDS